MPARRLHRDVIHPIRRRVMVHHADLVRIPVKFQRPVVSDDPRPTLARRLARNEILCVRHMRIRVVFQQRAPRILVLDLLAERTIVILKLGEWMAHPPVIPPRLLVLGALRASLGPVALGAQQIMRHIPAVHLLRIHRRHRMRPLRSHDPVDVIKVMRRLLQPQPARLVVIPVPRTEIHPAVRHIVHRLHRHDLPQPPRSHNLQRCREHRAHPQRKRHHHTILFPLVSLRQSPHLLPRHRHRLLQKQRLIKRSDLRRIMRMQVAPRPNQKRVVFLHMLQHLLRRRVQLH